MLMFVQAGIIVYLYQIRFQFPNLLPMEMAALYHLGAFMIGFLILILFAFLFEREREEALLREEGKAQALRESKRYIDDILERSPIPTFIMDRRHRIVQWNPACQTLTGISAAEILGKEVWEGFRMGQKGSLADMVLTEPGAVNDHFREAIFSKSESGWYELDTLLPHFKNGRRVLLGAGALLDETGAVRGAMQTVREISGASLDRALSDSGQVNEAFVSPVYKINALGKISSWNRGCEEVFGYPSSEMIGRTPRAWLPRATDPCLKRQSPGRSRARTLEPRPGDAGTGRENLFTSLRGFTLSRWATAERGSARSSTPM